MTRKNKKIIITSSITLLLVIVISLLLIFLPFRNSKLEEQVEYYYDNVIQVSWADNPVGWDVMEDRKPYETIICKFNLIEPTIGFIYTDIKDEEFTLIFYKLKRNNIFSRDWSVERNGHSSISHTTFSNLVSMVKDDCNQFKKSHYKDVPEGEPTWTYIRPQTEEEIKKQAEEDEQYQQEQKEFEEYLSSLPKWQRILEDKWDNSPQEDLFLFEKAKAENSCDFIELEHIAADEITNKDFINYCMSKYQPETIEYFHWEYLTTREARHQAFKDAIKNEDSE